MRIAANDLKKVVVVAAAVRYLQESLRFVCYPVQLTTMASPENPNNQEAIRRQSKGPPFKFLVPLVYAPVLPLIRLSLRHRPVLRDRLFTAVLVGAFAHGFYLVTDLYDIESK